MKSTGGKIRSRPLSRKQKNSSASPSSGNENNKSILDFFSPPRNTNSGLNNNDSDKRGKSTPRKRKNPLELLQSDLSPKYIGFRTPTSSEKRMTKFRKAKLNDSDGCTSYFRSNDSLIGCVRRMTSGSGLSSPKSSPEVPSKRSDHFESPIEKLLRKNGSVQSLPNSPMHDISLLSNGCITEVDKLEEVQNKKKNCVVRLEQLNHDLVAIGNICTNTNIEEAFDASRTEHDILQIIDVDEDEVLQVISVVNDEVLSTVDKEKVEIPITTEEKEAIPLVWGDDVVPTTEKVCKNFVLIDEDVEMMEVSCNQNKAQIDITPAVVFTPNVTEISQSDEAEKSQTNKADASSAIEEDEIVIIDYGEEEFRLNNYVIEVVDNLEQKHDDTATVVEENVCIENHKEEDLIQNSIDHEVLASKNDTETPCQANEEAQTNTIPVGTVESYKISEEVTNQRDTTEPITINPELEDNNNEQLLISKSKFSSEDLLSLKSPSTYSVDSAKGSSLDNDLNWVSIKTGDLYWGQIFTFAYWPCMVCPDPSGKTITYNENQGQNQHIMIHVRFFADNGRRSWVKKDNLMTYNGLDGFLKKKNEALDKYGNKSIKHKVFVVSKKSENSWNQAVREADRIEKVGLEERLEHFFQILEEVKVSNTLEKKRRQSIITSSTSDLCSMFDSNDNLYLKQASLKRDRSPTPVSPAFSPLGPKNSEKRIKLNHHNTRRSSFMDDLDVNSNANLNETTVSTEIELMQNDTIYNDIEFKKFASAMRSFILENSNDPKLNSEFMVNVRNLWAVKHVSLRHKLEVQSRSNGGLKRLSQRIRNISIQRSLPSTPVQSHEQQLPVKSIEPKPKVPFNRPIDEVVDDIFQLDSKYLFRDVSKEPICKVCLKGEEVVKCSMNCQTWVHAGCSGNHTKKSLPFVHITGDYEDEALLQKEIIPVICKECFAGEPGKCFVCKKDEPALGDMARCRTNQCSKFYHPSCLKYWPQAKLTKSSGKVESLRCPAHVCHTCVSDDPKGKYLHIENSKLVKCIKCPGTYHMDSTCIPAGSEFLSVTSIICPRHCKVTQDQLLNVNWCFICVAGGNLVCCETCPTAVHAECLKIPIAEDGYICEECETGRMPLYGEMVWAKFRNFRWWPSIILPPTEVPLNIKKQSRNRSEFVIRFFGSNDHGWISRRRVYLYQEGDSCESYKNQYNKQGLDHSYMRGIQEAKRIAEIIKEKKMSMQSNDKKQRVSPLPYVKIKINRGVPPVKLQIDLEKVSKCECDKNSVNPCGQDSGCLNRVLYHECNPKFCAAGDRCQNQMFEKRMYPKVEALYMNEKGFGLICLEPIKAGTFVIEYVGEIINDDEFRRRIAQKEQERDENFYFLTLGKDNFIDAGPKGNLARFMNHSCEPNCETQKWSVNGLNRIGLFAIKDIPKNSELTFNYFWDELLGNDKKNCKCGAEKCAGLIGGKYKEPVKSSPKKNKIIKRRMTNTKLNPSKKRQRQNTKPNTNSNTKVVKKSMNKRPKLQNNISNNSTVADTTAEEDKLLDKHASTSQASLTTKTEPLEAKMEPKLELDTSIPLT